MVSTVRPKTEADTAELRQLGERIRLHRQSRKLSQRAFANAAGVSKLFLGNVERGVQGASVIRIRHFARELGIDIAHLMPEAGPIQLPRTDSCVVPLVEAAEEKHYLERLGDRVRLLRLWRGMSQSALGATAGVSRNTVGYIERGKGTSDILILFRISSALRVEPGQIVSDTAWRGIPVSHSEEGS